ncbi:MAG TPA: integrin alpha, partial [Candidatus Omnitrophota bacterium]|nr:integrin alpha [Candidatus Omnitrophota bacterium]
MHRIPPQPSPESRNAMRLICIGLFTISLTCAIPTSSIYADPADLILDLRGPGQELGFGMATPAGDFNGVGFGDFVVGSGTMAYVYYGSSVPDSIPDLVLPFPQGAVEAHSISGGGDVNHDGFADIVIGSPLPEEKVLVFLGASNPGDKPAVTLT